MRNNYDIQGPSVCDVSEKIKKLIDEHLETQGIQVLHGPISIYSSEFKDIVDKKTSPRAKASLIEHKVRTTITNLMPTNPVFYTSLRQKLERIITEHNKQMIDDAQLHQQQNCIAHTQ